MQSDYKHLSAKLLTLCLILLGANTLAQNMTIGGTVSDEEQNASGLTAMFAGDRFENFRNLQRFTPTSKVTASKAPWDLGRNHNSLNFTGIFLGASTSLEEFIELSGSSAFLVIHKGSVVFEHYAHGDSRSSLHASFSVAKSFTSALLGIAIAQGKIDSLDDPIRKYLTELTGPAFDNVTVKHVLQMASGLQFNEDYTDPKSDINRMTTLIPPMTYLEFANTMKRAHAPGTYNHYVSLNTQLLGILLTRVTGKSLTDYLQTELWQPLGMEQPALWIVDDQGMELAMGGLAASARDYAKLGLLYMNAGKRGDTQILPVGWAEESVTPNEPHLLPGEHAKSSNVSGYQYQWWTPRNWDGDFLARGIWGQNIYVHPGNEVVIVKLAADQKNFQQEYKLAYIDYLQDLAQSLSTP